MRRRHESQWRQRMLTRASRDTRIGMLGLGDIGGAIATSLLPFDFQLSGWSRSRKNIPGSKASPVKASCRNSSRSAIIASACCR